MGLISRVSSRTYRDKSGTQQPPKWTTVAALLGKNATAETGDRQNAKRSERFWPSDESRLILTILVVTSLKTRLRNFKNGLLNLKRRSTTLSLELNDKNMISLNFDNVSTSTWPSPKVVKPKENARSKHWLTLVPRWLLSNRYIMTYYL